MNVGFLAASLTPQIGGGFTISEDILDALRTCAGESAHRFHFYERRGGANLRRQRALRALLKAGLPGQLRAAFRAAFRARLARALTRELLRDGVDVLWCALPDTPTLDIPFIVPVWDVQHRTHPFFPEVSRAGEWSRREAHYAGMLRHATFVVTGTEVGRDQLEFFYQVPRARIRILPHPTPGFALQAAAGKNDSMVRDPGVAEPYLFYPAQFWPHKNHVGLLYALKEVRNRTGMPLNLVLAGGDAGNADHVRGVTKSLDLGSCVHFRGFVDRAELVALYRRAAALVYLSFGGPENLPPLEAFALGCPVIASDIPGAAEQLGDAAVRVDPADTHSTANAIIALLNEPQQRAQLIQRGHARARRFTATDFVRGVFSLLDEFEPIRRAWR